jgi:hypothetical protein
MTTDLRHLLKPSGEPEAEAIHCDDVIHNSQYPITLRYFLYHYRVSALDRALLRRVHGTPKCFADFEDQTVQLTMASRFGDVGITTNLETPPGYDTRTTIDKLSNFRDKL